MFGTNLNEWQMMKTRMIPTNTPATATSLKKGNKMKKTILPRGITIKSMIAVVE